MIVGGLALLSKPIWIDILNLFLGELKFSIIGEFDWALGIVVILIALTYNLIHRYIDLKHDYTSKPAFLKVEIHTFKEFGELCQEILPLLKDNEYTFKTTGPNSDANNLGEMRTDFTLWNKLRKDVIVPNNSAIENLITKNQKLIPSKYSLVFQQMLLHIKAFSEHVDNPNFDYSEYQFPKEFTPIIIEESYKLALVNKNLIKISKWLKKNIKTDVITESFIFGSVLFTPQKANDVDVIFLSSNLIVYDFIDNLKFDFKLKFRKELHVTLFQQNETNYQNFINANPKKLKL